MVFVFCLYTFGVVSEFFGGLACGVPSFSWCCLCFVDLAVVSTSLELVCFADFVLVGLVICVFDAFGCR